ncbi:peptide chain release factor N(5)-glutamine methyltransferase [Fodinicurvata sediminis]|uniref:peptide chain release factor N(5)-glutamine methyltransferase n=1 Tax=Fodinicurvata sediminis TaxID=1121832 RepID=UPI0003B53D9C|nr:peptide chain release factor N(5)-glutamine methyltransferase [Fodinicurvata sediminis]
MTRAGILMDQAVRALRQAGLDSPRREARLLLSGVMGLPSGHLLAYPELDVASGDHARFEDALVRRVQGEPLSRILGRREFWSQDFEITPDVLDPRPDSETLIEGVLARAGGVCDELSVLDLGTGSGCLLLSLLHELPLAWGLGTDLSLAALQVAGRNAQRLGLAERSRFLCADWGASLQGRFDVIVCNPPYIAEGERDVLSIAVAEHDPAAALFAGRDGLAAYRVLARQLPRLLEPEGTAALEIGHEQADDVFELFHAAGAGSVELLTDLGGRSRCLMLSAFASVE